MATYLMGMNAKLYYDATAANPLSGMTEISNVKDLTLTLEAGEADVSTRANSGWRATATTLKACTVEWEMQGKTTDTAFEVVRDAFLNGTTLELAVLTGTKAVADSEGPKGTFAITNFSRGEPLEEAISVSVTAKLQVFDEWIEDGVEAGS